MSAGASLRPSDAAIGGFLDATIATAASVRFIDAYPNGTPSLLIEVSWQPEDGKARTELYRAGGVHEARPTADGSFYTPDSFKMRGDSNAMKLISSFIDGGFDESKLGIDIRVFAGTKVFLRTKAVPGYTKKDGTVVKANTILLVEKVLEMPGEGKKASPKAAKPVAAKPAPKADVAVSAPVVAEDGAAIEAELEVIVAEILAAAPENTIAYNRIGNAVFQYTMKNKLSARRAPFMLLMKNDAFLAGAGRPWAFDGENLVGQPGEEAAA